MTGEITIQGFPRRRSNQTIVNRTLSTLNLAMCIVIYDSEGIAYVVECTPEQTRRAYNRNKCSEKYIACRWLFRYSNNSFWLPIEQESTEYWWWTCGHRQQTRDCSVLSSEQKVFSTYLILSTSTTELRGTLFVLYMESRVVMIAFL